MNIGVAMGSSMGLQLVGGECGEGVYTNSPRARARFINLHTKKKVKEFKLKLRNYKRPDFNRMILDLGKCGWTHEKIADVLPVSGASTVSEWARGGVPNYDNGHAFIMLWQTETGIKRFPLEGEWTTYKYKIGQMDIFEDGGLCDQVIDELDRTLLDDIKPMIDHSQYENGDLIVYTDGQPVLLMVRIHFGKVLVSKFGSVSAPNKPLAPIRKATKEEIERYAVKQWKEEGRKGKPIFMRNMVAE